MPNRKMTFAISKLFVVNESRRMRGGRGIVPPPLSGLRPQAHLAHLAHDHGGAGLTTQRRCSPVTRKE